MQLYQHELILRNTRTLTTEAPSAHSLKIQRFLSHIVSCYEAWSEAQFSLHLC